MSSESDKQLKNLLDRQLTALESVLDVLAREQAALEARDTQALELLAAEKQDKLALAAAFEQQRRELAPSPAAMESLAESPEIARRWARLLDLTRACRDRNDANGWIVHRQQRRGQTGLPPLPGQGRQRPAADPAGGDATPRPATPRPITSA